MLEYFVLEITIVAQPPFAVSSREPSQGFREVESFPGLAHPSAASVRDVPGHAAHSIACGLGETLKLAAGIRVFAVVDEAALLNKQTAPVLRREAPGAFCRTNHISRHL